MQVTEDDISELLQRITTATYNVDGYYLGESSQGLGYSNMIYIHLQLKEYEKGVDPLKVNMFFWKNLNLICILKCNKYLLSI